MTTIFVGAANDPCFCGGLLGAGDVVIMFSSGLKGKELSTWQHAVERLGGRVAGGDEDDFTHLVVPGGWDMVSQGGGALSCSSPLKWHIVGVGGPAQGEGPQQECRCTAARRAQASLSPPHNPHPPARVAGTGPFTKSLKVLTALAHGRPIVGLPWLDACRVAGTWVDVTAGGLCCSAMQHFSARHGPAAAPAWTAATALLAAPPATPPAMQLVLAAPGTAPSRSTQCPTH